MQKPKGHNYLENQKIKQGKINANANGSRGFRVSDSSYSLNQTLVFATRSDNTEADNGL